MKTEQVNELVYQMLETERGGIQVYETALRSVVNDELRELWIESLGLPAVLPPPEEEKEVKTAIGAARAKKARKEML